MQGSIQVLGFTFTFTFTLQIKQPITTTTASLYMFRICSKCFTTNHYISVVTLHDWQITNRKKIISADVCSFGMTVKVVIINII